MFRSSSGHFLERVGDLAAVLTNLEHGDVLFIDEIHRLGPTAEEVLYPAVRDFQLDLVIGTGPAAKAVRIDLPHFTLVGATTRVGLTASPLHASFGIVHRFVFYSPDELSLIIQRTAELLEVPLDPEGAYEIARRSRGTPRIANRLLRRVRDFAQIQGNRRVDQARARTGADSSGNRRARSGRDRPQDHPPPHRAVRRRPCQPEGAGSVARRGSADRRGHLRAVLDPKGASATHRPRRRGHEAGVRAPGPARPGHAALGLEHLAAAPSTRTRRQAWPSHTASSRFVAGSGANVPDALQPAQGPKG